MNYRHAYHAGNFADCMKHALLVWLLQALARKPAAMFVLDTHAGAGRTDLAGEPARQTGEAEHGVGLLLRGEAPPALASYLRLVREGGRYYPGSPLLVRTMLRAQDRLACCELQPQEHAALRRLFLGDAQVAVHARDGWQATAALLPPRGPRRGLVLIDPPFERPGEFERLAEAVQTARRRFPGGVVAAWYPIKHRAPVRALHDRLRASGEPDLVCAELMLRPPLDAARLNGSGLLVAGPPWGFDQAATDILDAIADRLAAVGGESGARAGVVRLTPERHAA